MRKSLQLTYIIGFVFLLLSGGFAQPHSPEEVLIAVRASDEVVFLQTHSGSSRLYARLPEYLLVGVQRTSLSGLHKRQIRFVEVDLSPWKSSYAVVTSRNAHALERFSALFSRSILLSGSDNYLVSGDEALFAEMRSMGLALVDLEKREIPWRIQRTALPPASFHELQDSIDVIISHVSDSTIRAYIQGLQNFGTRYCRNENRDSVFEWIRMRFQDAGIVDVRLDSFQYSGTWQKNVVATIQGSLPIQRELVVGGHLDSYSSNLLLAPGADDNASGTAAVMEMARVLAFTGYRPNLSLRLIGFAAEEVGLKGSAWYAQQARQQGRDIAAMQNYDMIGYRNQSQPDNDVYVVWYQGAEALSDLHVAVMRAYTPLTPIPTTSYRSGSDSYSFFQQNYRSVFVIERDFSPYYHSPNDLLQYLDIPYARNIIRSGLATLLTMDALPPVLPSVTVRDRGDGSSLVVSWDSVATRDLFRYRIRLGTTSGMYDTSVDVTARTRTITGLTAGREYFAGVSLVDIVGLEGMIVESSAIPRLVPLSPAGLTATDISTAILLQWRHNGEMDLRGYNIYRSPSLSESFGRLNTIPLTDSNWVDSTVTAGVYQYFVTALDSAGHESTPSDTVEASFVVGVNSGGSFVPAVSTLYQNWPNPFNPSTRIQYELSARANVELVVTDLLGREVTRLVSGVQAPGIHSIVWEASGRASGVYYVALRVDGQVHRMKMLLVR